MFKNRKKISNEELKKVFGDCQNNIDDYYKEYKKLHGKKSKTRYYIMLETFFNETYDIYINGWSDLHQTRQDALQSVHDKLKISWKEVQLIFTSVNKVTAYT